MEKKILIFFLNMPKFTAIGMELLWILFNLKLSSGVNLILEIDVQGFRQINDLSFNYDSIFILPPSIHSLEERIKSRGDEDIESINLRLKNAKEELTHANEYKHIIINDSFDDAEKELFGIIAQEKRLIEKMRKKYNSF